MQSREKVQTTGSTSSHFLEFCMHVEERRSNDSKEGGELLRRRMMESLGLSHKNLDKEVLLDGLTKRVTQFYLCQKLSFWGQDKESIKGAKPEPIIIRKKVRVVNS